MSTNTLFIFGLVIFDGVAVAWAMWELWSIRPGRKDKADPAAAPPSSSEASGHPKR
jgi:hypothetical protein